VVIFVVDFVVVVIVVLVVNVIVDLLIVVTVGLLIVVLVVKYLLSSCWMSILSGEKFAENNYVIFNFQKYLTLFTKI
jgi:hypothetical protein